MPVILVLALLPAFAVMALLVLAAATAAERAVGLAAVERRRDHWRRLGEASHDVQLAADRYQRAMAASLTRNDGDGPAARRADEVRDQALHYQEACHRLARVLAGGPRPPRGPHLLDLLTDTHQPEAVAAARPADAVLAELADLQNALDAQAIAGERADLAWRLRASVRLGLLAIRARHGGRGTPA